MRLEQSLRIPMRLEEGLRTQMKFGVVTYKLNDMIIKLVGYTLKRRSFLLRKISFLLRRADQFFLLLHLRISSSPLPHSPKNFRPSKSSAESVSASPWNRTEKFSSSPLLLLFSVTTLC